MVGTLCCVRGSLRHVSTIGKKLVKQQCVLHMFSQYRELRPTNGWDRFGSLGHPSKFQGISHLAFVTAATSLTGREPNFVRCLAVFWAGTLYIHFRELLPPNRILPDAKFTSLYVQVLRSPILAALLHGTPAAGVRQPNFAGWYKEWNYGTFAEDETPYSAGRPSCWASAHILVLPIAVTETTASTSMPLAEGCQARLSWLGCTKTSSSPAITHPSSTVVLTRHGIVLVVVRNAITEFAIKPNHKLLRNCRSKLSAAGWRSCKC